ncbi:MAG: GNAT family N-acetyltransferase [Nitriliruptorales bacterium]
MSGKARWRRVSNDELDEVIERLSTWDCPPGGAVRHMFPLATIETRGAYVVRVAEHGTGWAAAIVLPGHLIVPCGAPQVIAAAGLPQRRWRHVVGDAGAAEPLLERYGRDPQLIVHIQRFQTVAAGQVPSDAEVPDPGLRRAVRADIDGLAELAVQLHIDDEYGPHPGRAGLRAYRQRMESAIRQGSVFCVGEPGDPLLKIERSVDSDRYGVQLSGVCVRPDARGEGLGTASVATAVRQALRDRSGPVSLHVRADNEPALRTYARAGFVDQEEWRLAVRS